MIEEVVMYPVSGVFNIEKMKLYLSDFIFVVPHPAQDNVFCLCGDHTAAEACRNRLSKGDSIPPVAVVRISPENVVFGLRAECEARIQAAEFAAIVIGRFPVGRIEDEEGRDVSKAIRQLGVLDFFGLECFEELDNG